MLEDVPLVVDEASHITQLDEAISLYLKLVW